jgi:hypothetical protein
VMSDRRVRHHHGFDFPWEYSAASYEVGGSWGVGSAPTSKSEPRCSPHCRPQADSDAQDQRPNPRPGSHRRSILSPHIVDRPWTERVEDRIFATSQGGTNDQDPCGSLIARSEPWRSNLSGSLPKSASTATHRRLRLPAVSPNSGEERTTPTAGHIRSIRASAASGVLGFHSIDPGFCGLPRTRRSFDQGSSHSTHRRHPTAPLWSPSDAATAHRSWSRGTLAPPRGLRFMPRASNGSKRRPCLVGCPSLHQAARMKLSDRMAHQQPGGHGAQGAKAGAVDQGGHVPQRGSTFTTQPGDI